MERSVVRLVIQIWSSISLISFPLSAAMGAAFPRCMRSGQQGLCGGFFCNSLPQTSILMRKADSFTAVRFLTWESLLLTKPFPRFYGSNSPRSPAWCALVWTLINRALSLEYRIIWLE